MNVPRRAPVVEAAAAWGATPLQRRRRLARARLAELVALRRAARETTKRDQRARVE